MSNSGEVQLVERPGLYLCHFTGGVRRVPPDTDKVFGVLMSNSSEVYWMDGLCSVCVTLAGEFLGCQAVV